jgi:hypothetical protein
MASKSRTLPQFSKGFYCGVASVANRGQSHNRFSLIRGRHG